MLRLIFLGFVFIVVIAVLEVVFQGGRRGPDAPQNPLRLPRK